MSFTSQQEKEDRRFMRLALNQARKGLGRSSPNPAVGAVVVKNGQVLGRGYHNKAGTPHAEVHALAAAGDLAKGATIYTTLEPCHHSGRTPPCSRGVMAAGITRVVYGASDPNPKAEGGGAWLKKQGVEVLAGVLQEACEEEHRFFLTSITKARPHVLLKTAATLDGKTATHTGHSRWVTGEASRRYVHKLRTWLDAICVGSGTALADDPSLTSRIPGGRDPMRIIVDSGLKLPVTAKVLDPMADGGCLVACAEDAPVERERALNDAGAQVLRLSRGPGGVDLHELMNALTQRRITSLLLEGGAELAWGFLQAGLVDEVMYFFAPKLIGGWQAPSMLGGTGFTEMSQAKKLTKPLLRRLGDDILLYSKVIH
jgi:diaminohydroxyphosphoribosylaminopyrimidine deaminase/5-amino-6-(5-phosphoribosylamino)uracil reductase